MITESRRKQLVAEACRRINGKELSGFISAYYCDTQRDQGPDGTYLTVEVTLRNKAGIAFVEYIRAYFPNDNRLRCVIRSVA